MRDWRCLFRDAAVAALAAAVAVLFLVPRMTEPVLATLVGRISALEARPLPPAHGVHEPRVEERVIELPEDGHTWHTILILRADWQSRRDERRAESMFHSEPLLVSLKRQTHWHLITADQPEFQKFRPLVDATPCLIVERSNGEVVYRESGPQLGRQAHALTRAIRREIERHCPDGRCLPLHPVPSPEAPLEEPDEIPAVLREEPRPQPHRLSPAMLLVALGGLAGGIAMHWRRTG
jgi:hypothetical protein